MSLEVGDRAPDFSLPADGGSEVALKDYKGKPVVLYFYPKDDASGCTAEACAFRDALPDFGKVKAGRDRHLPANSVASHEKFKAKFKLSFPLASDEGRLGLPGLWRLGGEEHVWQEIYGDRALDLPGRRQGRDPQGLAKGQVPGHAEEVLEAASSLKSR